MYYYTQKLFLGGVICSITAEVDTNPKDGILAECQTDNC